MPQTIVDLVLNHLASTLDKPRDDLYKLLEGWQFVPYIYNRRIAGTAIMRGTEVHFIMKPEFRIKAAKRGAARELCAKLMRGKHYLTTRVPIERTADLRFVTRLGFQETGRDGRQVFFMLTELPFERKRHEQ